MKTRTLSPEELSKRLSAYTDGELDAKQSAEVEEYLAVNEEARIELERIRAVKRLVGSHATISPDPTFWTRLSARIRQQQEEDLNLLPFPKRFAPAVAAFAVVAMFAIGVALFENRTAVHQFLTEKSGQVQSVYENGILKGSILPLFSNISKDQVLQFAMFGTLPLDAKAENSLRIDESTPQGYRIELGKGSEPPTPAVTVDKLLAEVRPSSVQKKTIDSLLERARKRISKAVLVAENNALVVDPELAGLNKVVLSEIAECLEAPQRVKLERFLAFHKAPFAIESHATTPRPPKRFVRKETSKSPERFIVITPDTFAMTELPVDVEMFWQQVVAGQHELVEVHARVQSLVRHFQKSEAARTRMLNISSPSVRVSGDSEFLEIEFQPNWLVPSVVPIGFDSIGFVVRARPRAPRPQRSGRVEIRGFDREIRVDDEHAIQFDSLMMRFMDSDELMLQRKRSSPRKRSATVRSVVKDSSE